MKVIPLAILSILTISSTLSAATYVTTSGLTQDILDIYGQAHSYSGPNLSSYANVPLAALYRADLTGAGLHRANLYGATLAQADLTGADLSRAYLTDSNLNRADLTGSNLFGANLTGASLINANLTGAVLIRVELVFADLTGANLSGADLFGARYVSTAFWTNSNLYGAILPSGYNQAWFKEEGAIFEETVPEPSSYALLLGGLALGLVAFRRR